MPDDLSATLAEIGENHAARSKHAQGLGANPADFQRLLDAVEAVLKEHHPIDRGRVMRCCAGCEEFDGEFHEACCHEWPCPTIEAITTALTGTGKEGSDE